MNQHTKDVYVVPVIIAVVVGFLLIPVAAWLTNQPMRTIVTKDGIRSVVFAYVPGWGALTLIICILVLAYILYRMLGRIREVKKEVGERGNENLTLLEQMKQKDEEHLVQIAALKQPQPKLHAVWNSAQVFWHMGRHGTEPMMQIGGWANLSLSDATEKVFLLNVYVEGVQSGIPIEIELIPDVLLNTQVIAYLVPPLEQDETKPFTATIVVEDHKNRKYELPRQTFRATPGQPPPSNLESAMPILHASWSGNSVWGWASAHPKEDPIYMIRGDVTLVLDNIKEPVIMTGVEIAGAESIGTFENFQLDPGQSTTRGMRLYFRGTAPKGNDYYTVQLVFKDLRGIRYPTTTHRFHSLPIPERVAIERGGHL